MTKTPLTAIRYAGGGQFSEVSISRASEEEWLAAIEALTGGNVVRPAATAFSLPFTMLCDEAGALLQPPTAIVVDLSSKSGIGRLFGPVLFVRRAGSGFNSVKPGDIERVRALPMWLRFEKLEPPAHVTTADELTAAGGEFSPQIHVIIIGSPRQQTVFVNAMWAKVEHGIIAYHIAGMPGGAHSVELMLAKASVADARRLIGAAMDEDGRLVGPWASLG